MNSKFHDYFTNLLQCGVAMSKIIYTLNLFPTMLTPEEILYYGINYFRPDCVEYALKMGANPNGILHNSNPIKMQQMKKIILHNIYIDAVFD